MRGFFKLALTSLLVVSAVFMATNRPAGSVEAVGWASKDVRVQSGGVAAPTARVSAIPVPAKKTSPPPPVAAPTCNKSNLDLDPAAISLSPGQNGVSQVVDQPIYYQVYGNTAAQVQAQIKQCSQVSQSGEDFAAGTYYTMNWLYDYTTDGLTCSIVNVAVGVHVGQVLPDWNPTASSDSGYAAKWRSFMANLQTHENGHRDLDIQYASKIKQDLKGLQGVSCSGIKQAADATANADLAALNWANDNYDAQTDHGQTQGAVIPD
ncbi:MAG TPA: DUF922 domain-containing protein [Candidatus Saccharimonadia bacterium]|nr:DUF922 domain-containing protein [Candidatus Saccharimonadia bacterium]